MGNGECGVRHEFYTSDALTKHVSDSDKGVGVLPAPGGNQEMKFINELTSMRHPKFN